MTKTSTTLQVTQTFETKLCTSCWTTTRHEVLSLNIPGSSIEIICSCGHVTNR